MKKHLTKILSGLALAAIAIFTYTLYSGEPEVRWFGYAEGEYVRVALPEGGTLISLSVARGDWVKSGDALFALESVAEEAAAAEAEAALEQARFFRDNLLKGLRDSEIDALLSQKEQAGAELELAAITLERQKNLLLSDNTSEQAVDQAEAVFERARGRVDELEAMLVTAQLQARVDQIDA
ncbi:MAG: biotin/lipoyl-binding protein, partial [Proteobacteria bacterium]|nr:biotin/lipoyl-binding protein [Pseudomonadota bacterium]